MENKNIKRVNITIQDKNKKQLSCIGFGYKKIIENIEIWTIKTIHGIYELLEENINTIFSKTYKFNPKF